MEKIFTRVLSHSSMAPKKMIQRQLCFAPRALLPERRAEGAIVVPAGEAAVAVVEPATGLGPAPGKKHRRDVDLDTKHEALKCFESSNLEKTMAVFPEMSRSTIQRLTRKAEEIRRAVHAGRGSMKRRVPLMKYKPLGEKLYEFFIRVRDAQGAVSRSLLESYIASLPQDIQLDLMSLKVHRRDEFFTRWRRWYRIVYRRYVEKNPFKTSFLAHPS